MAWEFSCGVEWSGVEWSGVEARSGLTYKQITPTTAFKKTLGK
jgi:hypothetical protein